jgi:ATPase subunit of ABC transporter with duplicated ATPase domains
MVDKIVELYQQDLHFYYGNYSFYEKKRNADFHSAKRPMKIKKIISSNRKDS